MAPETVLDRNGRIVVTTCIRFTGATVCRFTVALNIVQRLAPSFGVLTIRLRLVTHLMTVLMALLAQLR